MNNNELFSMNHKPSIPHWAQSQVYSSELKRLQITIFLTYKTRQTGIHQCTFIYESSKSILELSDANTSLFSQVQKPFKSIRMLTTVSPWPELIRSCNEILYGSFGRTISKISSLTSSKCTGSQRNDYKPYNNYLLNCLL